MRTMTGLACASLLSLCLGLVAAEPPKTAPLGSPEFYPSPERPVGWRGDGTGCYPGAEPPVEWGIISKAVRDLSSQCRKPKDGDTGNPIPGGVIRDWLVLSRRTWSQEQDDKTAASLPDENDKVDTDAWKAATTDTSVMDFDRIFSVGKEDTQSRVAYAHAYFYSRSGKSLFLKIINCGDAGKDSRSKAWCNGKLMYENKGGGYDDPRLKLPVTVGWNRLLIKVHRKTGRHWFFDAQFFGTDKNDYEKSSNILWICPSPVQGDSDVQGGGVSSPIIVGNKLFVTWERQGLCCLDKNTGRILWLRTSTYADLATEDEKKAKPEIFKEVEPLVSQLREMNAQNTSSVKVEMKILGLMKQVDRDKYSAPSRLGEPGYAPATPTSDGQNVYALFGSGMVVCYDLNGNRRWAGLIELENGEHGNCSSPLWVDDMLVISRGPVKSAPESNIIGIDARTGKTAWCYLQGKWQSIRSAVQHTSAVRLSLNGENCFATLFAIGRPRDGTVLYENKEPYNSYFSSPVVYANAVYGGPSDHAGGHFTHLYIVKITGTGGDKLGTEEKKVRVDTREYPQWSSPQHMESSPLYCDGLVYWVSCDGILSVIDAEKGEIVYHKLLDLGVQHVGRGAVRGGVGSSPALAGKYLYICGDVGTTLVLEPGRTYKQVARNRIEGIAAYGYNGQEIVESSPVFEGKRMYVRTDANIYCIGER